MENGYSSASSTARSRDLKQCLCFAFPNDNKTEPKPAEPGPTSLFGQSAAAPSIENAAGAKERTGGGSGETELLSHPHKHLFILTIIIKNES